MEDRTVGALIPDQIQQYLQRTRSAASVTDWMIHNAVKAVIAIPAKDEPDLVRTLESLKAARLEVYPIGVLVVFNGDCNDEAFRKRANAQEEQFNRWKAENSALVLHSLQHYDVQAKWAGVGDARKMAMDSALLWLNACGVPEGLIVCLDADCEVATNYCEAILQLALDSSVKQGGFYFEHRTTDGSPLDESIIIYETYLRYYKIALQWAGHPMGVHTVGSTMAVKAEAYWKAGGMNRRKAGEDFYFLQKLSKSGELSEFTDTVVYPSPRQSDRVPFGTGAAMNRWSQGDPLHRTAFSMQSFKHLKTLFEKIENLSSRSVEGWLADQEEVVQTFIADSVDELEDIQRYGTSSATLRKRFYQWFNGLKCLQFLKHASATNPNQPIAACVVALGQVLGEDFSGEGLAQLEIMRQYEQRKR